MFLWPIPVKLALWSHISNCSPDSCLRLYNSYLKRRKVFIFLLSIIFTDSCVFFMMLFQLQAGLKIHQKPYSQAFMYLTFLLLNCNFVGRNKKGRQKRHTFFDFLPINVWNCNNFWDRQPVAVSCGYRIRVALSLALSLSVVCVSKGLVTLWGLRLFNEVVICLHRGSPSNVKFTVSSGSVYNLLCISNKNSFNSMFRNRVSNDVMCFSSIDFSLSSVMVPRWWVRVHVRLTCCWYWTLCLWLYCAEGQMQIVS